MRIYGDGSHGTRTISASTTLVDENMQYTSFTVQAGVTLTVPSGTKIRCTEQFVNHGTIVVAPGESGGIMFVGMFSQVGQGVAHAPPNNGNFGDGSADRYGGFGGSGLSRAEAATLLNVTPAGGGGGAIPTVPIVTSGGNGGGTFTVLAAEGITNDAGAFIHADGKAAPPPPFMGGGGGGGGGGIVVLASRSYVENQGTITARGGEGGGATTTGGGDTTAGGGGGGGGIIHFLAPDMVVGTIDVSGAAGGAADGQAPGARRSGGGGGGACGGAGGAGGLVFSGGVSPFGGDPGSIGYFITSTLDPTSLF